MTQDNETKYTRRALLKQSVLGLSGLVVAGSGLLAGCGGSDDEDMPINTSDRSNSLSSMARLTTFVRLNNNPDTAFDCWIAVTPSQRDEGLAFVTYDEMSQRQGMTFVFPDNRTLSYAGRNTQMALDVVYAVGVGPGVGVISDIGTIDAFQRIPFVSSRPAQFALMVRQGELARTGAAVGDYIYVPVNTPTR